ncbi:hypothetical protein HG530_007136 [Fusarium avenaceum]|nr:hypothetical protein DER45DRAFT_640905 [Fusarium avenaceum]KAI6766066.1 hypothetical protein HG530_007136 [Fusarium avenaceum]
MKLLKIFIIELWLLITCALSVPFPIPEDGQTPPDPFTSPNISPGGLLSKNSTSFQIIGGNPEQAERALEWLEGAFDCFAVKLQWGPPHTSIVNFETHKGPFPKLDVYSMKPQGHIGGRFHHNPLNGNAWLQVVDKYLDSGITIHEYGHSLHHFQNAWVHQGHTKPWMEAFSNWVRETYDNSEICAGSRQKQKQGTHPTIFDPQKVLGYSYQVIVHATPGFNNQYEAWPFLTYLTNNPDDFAGLGQDSVRQLQLQYEMGSGESPLHTLARISTNATVGDIVGRYWARMAYVDINHPLAQDRFYNERGRINLANVRDTGNGTYKPHPERRPQYMGANIIPIKVFGWKFEVKVTSDDEFVATVVIHQRYGKTSYVTLVNGAAKAYAMPADEISVVVANAPAKPILYDGFRLSKEVTKGLDYTLELTGAVPVKYTVVVEGRKKK